MSLWRSDGRVLVVHWTLIYLRCLAAARFFVQTNAAYLVALIRFDPANACTWAGLWYHPQ